MKVKKFLKIYNNSFGCDYVVFDDNVIYGSYNTKEEVINEFGDRIVAKFRVEDESTRNLIIYV